VGATEVTTRYLTRYSSLTRYLILFAAIALGLPAAVGSEVLAESSESGGEYTPGGPGACTECHDQPATLAILRTPHGVKGDAHTPFAAQGCEACHGPSASHAADEDVPVALAFGDEYPAEPQNAVVGAATGASGCWNGSIQRRTLRESCHNIHNPRQAAQDIRPGALVRMTRRRLRHAIPTWGRPTASRRIRSRKVRSPATTATTCTARRRSICSSSAT
jgi:hypothetical protein